MTAFDHLLVQRQDELDRRFAAAIELEPVEERDLHRQIWSMLRHIESTIAHIRSDLRDCNVILARTIDRCARFEAGGIVGDA